ncbi:MAG TPA: hypothetical protein VEH06_18355 [Candidatus Bathyarchaeia archaeon]|nr:hypothetical protein [Candidatus Bathyarchaeia archaeon]
MVGSQALQSVYALKKLINIAIIGLGLILALITCLEYRPSLSSTLEVAIGSQFCDREERGSPSASSFLTDIW